MMIAQISDPHIVAPGTLLYGRVDTAGFLARAVGELNRLDPLARYRRDHRRSRRQGRRRPNTTICAICWRRCAMPVFVIPGNHDAREPLRAAFGGDGYLPRDGFLQYAVEDYPVRLVALDTLVPGEGGGAAVRRAAALARSHACRSAGAADRWS